MSLECSNLARLRTSAILNTVIILAATSCGIVASRSVAAVPIAVSSGPPAPPVVVNTPQPSRRGHTWVPPMYQWTGARWVWRDGVWIRNRPGSYWVQPTYDAGRKLWTRGHWRRGARP